MFPGLRPLVVLIALLAATGCQETIDRVRGKEPPPCPRIAILSDAAQYTQFRPGAGRDITDIAYEAEIVGYEGYCTHHEKNASIEVVLKLMIDVTRGPAGSDGASEIRYFFAVPDRAKQVFASPFKFERGTPKIRMIEDEIVVNIPMRSGDSVHNADIWVGFQLSPDQLELNRKRKR